MSKQEKEVNAFKPRESAPVVEAPKELEASTVETVEDTMVYGNANMEDCLQTLAKKLKNLKFAWVNRKDLRFRQLGWRPIRLTGGGDRFEECKAEEAECTTENVLCVRDMKIENIIRAPEIQALRESNRQMIRERNTSTLAESLTKDLQGMAPGLRAIPLPGSDPD